MVAVDSLQYTFCALSTVGFLESVAPRRSHSKIHNALAKRERSSGWIAETCRQCINRAQPRGHIQPVAACYARNPSASLLQPYNSLHPSILSTSPNPTYSYPLFWLFFSYFTRWGSKFRTTKCSRYFENLKLRILE